MQKVSFFLLVLLSFFNAGAQKNAFTLSFGSGGGFSGGSTIYSVDNTGKLYKQQKLGSNLTAQPQELAKLTKKEIREIKKLMAEVNFPSLQINTPGNMSQFVNLKENGQEFKTTWSGSTSGNSSLDQLYQKLNSLIPHH